MFIGITCYLFLYQSLLDSLYALCIPRSMANPITDIFMESFTFFQSYNLQAQIHLNRGLYLEKYMDLWMARIYIFFLTFVSFKH